jgi:hypothetical protein
VLATASGLAADPVTISVEAEYIRPFHCYRTADEIRPVSTAAAVEIADTLLEAVARVGWVTATVPRRTAVRSLSNFAADAIRIAIQAVVIRANNTERADRVVRPVPGPAGAVVVTNPVPDTAAIASINGA